MLMHKNWLSKLKSRWLVITYKDYMILKRKTKDFVYFYKCNASDFNLLRILYNLSYKEVTKKTGFSYSWVTKVLREEKQITINIKQKLSKLFKDLPKVYMGKKDLIVKTEKHFKRISSKFRDASNIDDDIVKWFAILHAEGYSRDKGIVVVQKNYPELLRDFITISKEKFKIDFGKVWVDKNGVERYEFYSYPFIDYLKFKFGFNIGPSRESNICNWILRLPKYKQKIFLKYFYQGDGYFSKKGLITVTQVNNDNIRILSKILKKFNIKHHLYAQARRNKVREWKEYSIVISDRDNIKRFLYQIGTLDKERFKRVYSYLNKNNMEVNLTIQKQTLTKTKTETEEVQPEVNIGLVGHY